MKRIAKEYTAISALKGIQDYKVELNRELDFNAIKRGKIEWIMGHRIEEVSEKENKTNGT